ncbi:cytochrome o ubiquinol oxidase subunit IV [Mangrovibacterium diazotrophicum]|uniref:Cytochrome bo(3) ubiquinol oxidase subunit 4 n=1 Tax=Mangrovibacterium diazotrophicum TaxID=1261403 RepID=A0A419WAE5_9BACT|nr:cytochrome o ubiquinol oxidase subunit IV [Mangrovibacterium diazotrophicum]RKD92386.1 cytochrome bo3 quinol oxidase subunit 4 [Mangrovibacterium diazotrophicum]
MSNHTHTEVAEASHSGAKSYIVGFVLAVVFTLISFAFAMMEEVPKKVAFIGLSIAALMQMFVHMRYFLHLDTSKAQRWNVVFIAFTAVLVFIFVGGTIWVMVTLNSRMM